MLNISKIKAISLDLDDTLWPIGPVIVRAEAVLADWLHTQQSRPFLPLLRKVVSVGRVKWIPDSKMTGKENCAWHLFWPDSDGVTRFVGRAA